jgi:hypothetical protein
MISAKYIKGPPTFSIDIDILKQPSMQTVTPIISVRLIRVAGGVSLAQLLPKYMFNSKASCGAADRSRLNQQPAAAALLTALENKHHLFSGGVLVLMTALL